jgi:hypothetical protein
MIRKFDAFQISLLCGESVGQSSIPKDAIESLADEFPISQRIMTVDMFYVNENGYRRPMTIRDMSNFSASRIPNNAASRIINERIIHGATGVLLNDGRVLICSSYGQFVNVPLFAIIFDPFDADGRVDHTSQADCMMYACRSYASLVTLANGEVLRMGGGTDQMYPGDCALFNPSTKEWRLLKENAPRMAAGAFSILLRDGRVLVSGGRSQAIIMWTCWLYDPATEKFAETGHMVVRRERHAGCLMLSGDLFVCGGLSEHMVKINSCEKYNIQNGTWERLPDMHRFLHDHHCMLMPNGKIAVIGITGRHSAYDPIDGAWSPVTELSNIGDLGFNETALFIDMD